MFRSAAIDRKEQQRGQLHEKLPVCTCSPGYPILLDPNCSVQSHSQAHMHMFSKNCTSATRGRHESVQVKQLEHSTRDEAETREKEALNISSGKGNYKS